MPRPGDGPKRLAGRGGSKMKWRPAAMPSRYKVFRGCYEIRDDGLIRSVAYGTALMTFRRSKGGEKHWFYRLRASCNDRNINRNVLAEDIYSANNLCLNLTLAWGKQLREKAERYNINTKHERQKKMQERSLYNASANFWKTGFAPFPCPWGWGPYSEPKKCLDKGSAAWAIINPAWGF